MSGLGHAPFPRPKLVIDRRGSGHRQKHPMPRWSHQQELDSMMGKEITISFKSQSFERIGEVVQCSAEHVTGMLVNADSFTIQLGTVNKSVVTYFKHDIRSYELRPIPVK